jgi:hypothetical protein
VGPIRRLLNQRIRHCAIKLSDCLNRRRYAFYQLNIDRCWLSVAARRPRPRGMRTGGWRDVAVDARMIIGVELSGALRAVIGTITETLPLLRQCSRGCAQQQSHCHAKFYCAHGHISSRSRSISSHGRYCLPFCLFVQLIHKILLNRLDLVGAALIELPNICASTFRGRVLQVSSRLAGAIKLPFRKLNSVLCEEVWRNPNVGVREGAISMSFHERSDKRLLYCTGLNLCTLRPQSVSAT